MANASETAREIYEFVAKAATDADAFESVKIVEQGLECRARASAAPAAYRVEEGDGGLWVSLVMSDRWLSESIEADLMHSGDKLEELLEEELAELGYEGSSVRYEHFRSDDLLFTFRSQVSAGSAQIGSVVAQYLLAYEACFRNLGDMFEADEDE